jgi:hypothetical protein
MGALYQKIGKNSISILMMGLDLSRRGLIYQAPYLSGLMNQTPTLPRPAFIRSL